MAKRKPKESGLAAAISAVGTARELAKRLGISPAAVSTWKKVPWNRARAVERVTGVPREVLRPDIFAEDDDENTSTALGPASICSERAAAR